MPQPFQPYDVAALPVSASPEAADAAVYASETTGFLFGILLDIVREPVLEMIEEEYHRTVRMVLRVGGGQVLGIRFPRDLRRVARRMTTIRQANHYETKLLRRYRSVEREDERDIVLQQLCML